MLLALLTFAACQNQPAEKKSLANDTPAADSQSQEPDTTTASIPAGPPDKFEVQTSTGKTFVVTRSDNPDTLIYTVQGIGFKVKSQFEIRPQAPVTEVRTADINGDGFDEVYILTDTSETDERTPALYAFASYRDRSFGPIYVKAIPKAKRPDGKSGLHVKDGKLIREFASSHGTKSIEYHLRAGEAGFVLTPR